MHLQRQLVLPQARIKKVKIELGAEEHRVTLEIKTALTQEVADAFGCRELIFAGSVPRSGVEKMSLEGSEIDCDVHLKHDSFSFNTVVESMDKYVAKMEGTGPELVFNIKFKGYVITVADLIEHVKVDPLEITLNPAQMPLDLVDEKPVEAPAEDNPCVDCANSIPILEDSFPVVHASGQLCSDPAKQEAPPIPSEPALASVTSMGGSHQKAPKRGRRGPVPPIEPEPSDDDFMQDSVQ